MLEGPVDKGKPDVLYSVRFCNMSLFARLGAARRATTRLQGVHESETQI
jgi:hypothetical protein